jgi:pimeloyl-ACP methyl ester carboxylesterase
LIFAGLLLLPGCAALPSAPVLATFRTEDGAAVTAQLSGSGQHGVVLVSGGHGVGETWDAQARRLAAAGLRVAAIDHRGRGRSTGQPDDARTHLDVLAAVRALRAEGARQISVVAASAGGEAAGTAGVAAPGLIDRFVFLAHTPFQAPERLGGRKMFIVARTDRDGAGRLRIESIRRQYELTPGPKELVLVDGSAHAQFLFLTPQGEQVLAHILRFLRAP